MTPELLYNSVTVNLPKNIAQFLLGSVIFLVIHGSVDVATLVIALIGFNLAYSSVYIYNDMTDASEDRRDPNKLPWKPVANGSLSLGSARRAHVILLAAGLLVSFMVGALFFAMVLALLTLNFIHSSPAIRLKNHMAPTMANIGAMAFIKFSLGWFALTSVTSGYPVLFFLMMGVVYVMGYMSYKSSFWARKKNRSRRSMLLLGSAVAVLFIFSLFFYIFPLSMIMLLLLYGVMYVLRNTIWSSSNSFRQLLVVDMVIIPVLIVPFLVLLIPAAAAVNNTIVVFLMSIF